MSKKPKINRSKALKDEHLLKDEQIRALFGISQSSLYKWRKNKQIPFFKMGGTNYYLEDVIIKMLYLRGGRLSDDIEEEE
jgi:hypothetical protein